MKSPATKTTGLPDKKWPTISASCWKPAKETLLRKILRRCGSYYHSADLFYQELWKQRMGQIGFRGLSVEKLPYHDVWDIRVCGNLAAQTYLLTRKPVGNQQFFNPEPLIKPLRCEVQRLAKDLGATIKSDCITVARNGAYFRVAFIWPLGKPGRLLKTERKAEAFSFLIRQWLRRVRN